MFTNAHADIIIFFLFFSMHNVAATSCRSSWKNFVLFSQTSSLLKVSFTYYFFLNSILAEFHRKLVSRQLCAGENCAFSRFKTNGLNLKVQCAGKLFQKCLARLCSVLEPLNRDPPNRVCGEQKFVLKTKTNQFQKFPRFLHKIIRTFFFLSNNSCFAFFVLFVLKCFVF